MSFANSSTRITSFHRHNLARKIQESIKSKGKKRQTEERNLLIDEMRVEIERLGAQNKSLVSNEADKIRLRYLEGIVHELKRKLAAATGSSPSDYTFGSTSLYDIENSWGCFQEKSFHIEDIASSDNEKINPTKKVTKESEVLRRSEHERAKFENTIEIDL